MQNKKGYQHTTLGWIPEDWEVLKLNDIVKLISGQHLSANDINTTGEGTPYFTGPTDIVNDSSKITKWTTSKTQKARTNDILIVVKGSGVGQLFMHELNETIGLGRQLMGISYTPSLYLFYYLQTKLYYLRALSMGNMIPGLSRNDILSLDFVAPPLPEQTRIADCLSTWDTAIQSLRGLIEQKQQQKKWLMQQLLTGKKRLKGFEGKWKECKLNDVIKRVTTKNTELNDNVVTISAQRGFVRQEEFFNKRVASETLSGYYLIQKGDFAYNKSYSNGYPMGAFKRLDILDKAVVTTLYICFRPKNNVDADFLKYYFDGGQMVNGLMRIAQEGGRAHGLLNISLPDFFNLPLILPSKEEQTAIAQVLQCADTELELLQQQLAGLEEQKKGLMQLLLTGEKRLV